jgi:3',5'-cyclic AMP phosphodiesterase CpdA
MLTIAHVSDTHLGSRPEALDRARRVLDHVRSLDPAPDLLLVTGDIADHGRDEEYAQARDLFAAWRGPLLVGTGNHDARVPFARGLLGSDRTGPLNSALDVADHRFLMLDSLVPAQNGRRIDHGELELESVSWLDDELSASNRPTFICLHHPPTTIGVQQMDQIQLRNPADLEPVLRRHLHVKAILVGHNHTMCVTTFADRPVLVGGGVASTVTLDAEPLDHLWLDAPPTLALHLVDDTGRLTTFWRALP